jgi:hypothetical protein
VCVTIPMHMLTPLTAVSGQLIMTAYTHSHHGNF